MRSSIVSLVLVLVGLFGNARAEPAPRKPASAAALDHYTRGARLYGNAAFAEAIEEFKAAALVEPAPAIDFNLGVCYRLLGERAGEPALKRSSFESAIWHYERFVRASPETPERAAEIQKLVAEMRAVITALPPEPPPPIKTPAPTSDSMVPPIVEPTTTPEPFYADGVAWALTGSGIAALGVASGLYWSAASLREDANATLEQKEQDALRGRADTRSLVATTLAIVGGGILVGGVIKLIVHDTSSPAHRRPVVDVGLSRHGLFVFGQF